MNGKTFRHEIVDSMREIVFGLEDSLVSTLGAVTGIAVGTQNQYVVVLSGFVLIAAEGMSMAAGSYLSSKHAAEAAVAFHRDHGREYTREGTHPIRAACVMGIFYFLGGFVPLAFYLVMPVSQAIIPSIVLTAFCLFLVGVWAASFTKTSKLRSGFEMTIVSLAAALIGYLIGRVVSAAFGINVVG